MSSYDEFLDASRSIQYTAIEERRLHTEALDAAFARHQEIRAEAEQTRDRAVEDLIQRQRLLEYEEALRSEILRKEVAEKSWRVQQKCQEEIAAAQLAQAAADRQREENIAAQAALNAPRPTLPTSSLTNHIPPPSSPRPQSITPQKTTTPIAEPAQMVAPASMSPVPRPVQGVAERASSVSRPPSLTYLGLPLPESLPPLQQHQYLEYIQILLNLKEHRKIFLEQVLPNPQFRQAKAQVGDDRRFIKKSIGQLTEDRKKNKEIMDKVMARISSSMNSPFPKVSLSRFLPSLADSTLEMSSYYIYLINIFTKAIFSQFLVDATSDTRKADAIGLFASQLLATAQQQLGDQFSLFPLLLAKFARRCPVLFGVYGNEATNEGKTLLGYGKEDGRFVTEQRHAERMTALAAGWASITLRDYNKSRLENPAPTWFFWRSIALILNVPKKEVTNTHYLVLKALIEHNEARILKLFGIYGRMILQQAIVEYPNNNYSGNKVSAQGLRLLGDIWERDLHFRVL